VFCFEYEPGAPYRPNTPQLINYTPRARVSGKQDFEDEERWRRRPHAAREMEQVRMNQNSCRIVSGTKFMQWKHADERNDFGH
jgi:hypothetical protein